MRSSVAGAWFTILAATSVCGQTVADSLRFEVASVKRHGDSIGGTLRGGPGTADPERITYVNVSLQRLILIAYAPHFDAAFQTKSGMDFDQISGPAWIESANYDILAKVPKGATAPQVQEMWRNLLADRFHLVVHHTTKEFPGYELLIAKNGPRLKESPGADNAPAPPPGTRPELKLDKDGFAILPPGAHYFEIHPGAHSSRLTFRGATMSDLVQRLGWPLSSQGPGGASISMGRVEDKTGLTGKYDFTLKFSGLMSPGGAFTSPTVDDQDEGGQPLFQALEKQLGLKLVEKKLLLDVVVIDHVDKVPTEN